MYDPDWEDNAPYDNVEFPIVRKAGTGTWPGPTGGGGGGGGSVIGNAGPKLLGPQSGRGTLAGVPKLAPLVEVDGGSESNDRFQNVHNLTSSNHTNGAGALNGSSSSVASSSSSLQSSSASKQAARTQFLASKPPGATRHNQPATVAVDMSSNPSPPFSPPSSSSPNPPRLTTTAGPAPTTTTTTTTTAATTRAATVTTKTTTATSSSSSSSSSSTGNSEKSVKQPVIKFSNDNNLYMPTEVTDGDGTKKKAARGTAEAEDDDFKRHDLNPGSRRALEGVYTQHEDFYQLNSKVLDEGSLLKQDVLDIYRKTGETLTYEQLLQGMLVDGERFLLGSCWLYFTHVQFLDLEATKTLREPYGRGRIGLTSKRALFLSTETYTDASLEQFAAGDSEKKKKKPDPGYKLEVSKRSCVTFKNIPLSNFHSAEMEVVTGTAAQTKITRKTGCCACLGLPWWGTQWVSTTPMTRSIASRVVRVGVSMPPWQTRMFMDIHLDPSMSLTVARDFISQLHAFAPHMH